MPVHLQSSETGLKSHHCQVLLRDLCRLITVLFEPRPLAQRHLPLAYGEAEQPPVTVTLMENSDVFIQVQEDKMSYQNRLFRLSWTR